ncbi:MAG: FAD-dependent oxidoreductase [Acidobacteria bacterium]|nr:MAG: FAD-dependent oxidoreductase [Acidobacteriota bacterium]
MLTVSSIDRRRFLRDTITVAGFSFAAAAIPTQLLAQTAARRFAPVKVSRDRVIREVVGLRPFRPEGYLVDAERAGAKLLVHNYGHGGAGITLSWGTAVQAVDLVRDFSVASTPRRTSRPTRFAVIGCGVNGLSTAIMIQRRYAEIGGTVTIYAKDLPPDTTSNIAGGFWSPTSVYDGDAASTRFLEQFRTAARISNRAFQLLVGADYGVRWFDTFDLGRSEASLQYQLPGGNDLYPQLTVHRDPEHYFGFPFVRQYSTMIIEPQVYLRSLLRDFHNAGGRIVVKEFRNREEVLMLPDQVIFNCSGLGARALFDDKKLTPVRGQLEILLPQPEVDYCYLGGGYMFPRSDGIVLGGTFDHDNWSLDVNREQANYILNSHMEIMRAMQPRA